MASVAIAMRSAARPEPPICPSPASAASIATGPPKMASVSTRRPRREMASASRVCASRTTIGQAMAKPSAAATSAWKVVLTASAMERRRPTPAAAAQAIARGGAESSRRRADATSSAIAPMPKSAIAPPAEAATGPLSARLVVRPVHTRPSTSAAAPHAAMIVAVARRTTNGTPSPRAAVASLAFAASPGSPSMVPIARTASRPAPSSAISRANATHAQRSESAELAMASESAADVHTRARTDAVVSPGLMSEPSMPTTTPIPIASHARADDSAVFTAVPAT